MYNKGNITNTWNDEVMYKAHGFIQEKCWFHFRKTNSSNAAHET